MREEVKKQHDITRRFLHFLFLAIIAATAVLLVPAAGLAETEKVVVDGITIKIPEGTTLKRIEPKILRGNEHITIEDAYVDSLELRDSAKATLKKNAKVGILSAKDASGITLEDKAEVQTLVMAGASSATFEKGSKASGYLEARDNSVLRFSGGSAGFLFLKGNSQAHVHQIQLDGIILDPRGARLHVYTDEVGFFNDQNDRLMGKWGNGEPFSIVVMGDQGVHLTRQDTAHMSLPPQIIAHPLSGPSFDCAKASTSVEKTICSNEEVAALDKKLAHIYKQTLAASSSSEELLVAQKKWLTGQRNKCSDALCLKKAYETRIRELNTLTMTDDKAQAICTTIVKAVNDGSLAKRFQEFHAPTPAEKQIWEKREEGASYYLGGTLTIKSNGKTRTLGILNGGGTCSSCDIIDIAADKTALYPRDGDGLDYEDHIRWAGWGACDHFLFVDGPPIVVTGNFDEGKSEARLVAWIAPDGAKRALCALEPSEDIQTKTVRDEDHDLCAAVAKGQVTSSQWSESLSVEREKLPGYSDSNMGAVMDIDMDGIKETIILDTHESGGGCGSTHQWLLALTPDRQAVAKSRLNDTLTQGEWGPIKAAVGNKSPLSSVKLFKYKGKPYILGVGNKTSAEVSSVWGGTKRVWCEYLLYPQHKIAVSYPVATWPAQ